MKRLRGLFRACLLILALLAAPAVSEARWPQQGKDVKTKGKMKLDVSNTSEGYFMASVKSKSKKRLKLRVEKGGQTLTYDLNGEGDFEVFPLQLGSGKYSVTLYENVSGKKYSQAGKMTLNVKLAGELQPFLYPNQYVHYREATEAVSAAAGLCGGKQGRAAFDEVCGFMKSRFVYDYVKAVTVKAGMLPDIEGAYEKKMGICQDLAAIMVCMLRTQGIPARLMIGYADRQYHAWTTTVIDGQEVFYDPTAAINGIGKVREYTVERYY